MELCSKCASSVYKSLRDREIKLLYYLAKRKDRVVGSTISYDDETKVIDLINTVKKISIATHMAEFNVRTILRSFEIIGLVRTKKLDHSISYFITDSGEQVVKYITEDEEKRIKNNLKDGKN